MPWTCVPCLSVCLFDICVPTSGYVWCPPQEEMALELINSPDYELQMYQHSYLRSTVILILSLFMVLPGSPW